MHGVEKVDKAFFSPLHLQFGEFGGNPMKLTGRGFRVHEREVLLHTLHTVNLWNSLPQDVEQITSLVGFKRGSQEVALQLLEEEGSEVACQFRRLNSKVKSWK